MKKIVLISLIIFSVAFTGTVSAQTITSADGIDTSMGKALHEIRTFLESKFFVNRSVSVETPCLCINSNDISIALPPNSRLVNSNYKIMMETTGILEMGYKCLSENIARYMRFSKIALSNDTLSGMTEMTYQYPASSLIQFYGFANNDLPANQNRRYFDFFKSSKGTFLIYPSVDRLVIEINIPDEPYGKKDTISGYIEIARKQSTDEKVAELYFDNLNIERGDKYNAIFLKFASTDYHNEGAFYQTQVYQVLRYLNSADPKKHAQAYWLNNFLLAPGCTGCVAIYRSVQAIINSNSKRLPNTEPLPAH